MNELMYPINKANHKKITIQIKLYCNIYSASKISAPSFVNYL
jgi:hypothetical protein